MASIFTHCVVAGSLSQISPKLEKKDRRKFIFLLLLISVVPDLDVIGLAYGIPYQHPLGHRGLTHSFFFSFLMALFACFFLVKTEQRFTIVWWWLLLVLFVSASSHGVLDAMTDGGLGVGFFIPFSQERYFLDWRPIKVSPIGVTEFFAYRAWLILKSEIIFIWIPVLSVAFILGIVRRLVNRDPSH